ncbi:hypothetical protein [Nostoc sphaeroides]|uniref:Uncharacterized protein n=1 Tax=Nostoc sphaeroides CCNUC1 TaxID=2653204 RepID=A0A5P8VUC6_9NOSO|nr:hypothetical protein [Nostoc sphaeroides]QFS44058.1 hypothetical protein GXM_01531 [Nostoc sphaeroides CCNUC1]
MTKIKYFLINAEAIVINVLNNTQNTLLALRSHTFNPLQNPPQAR